MNLPALIAALAFATPASAITYTLTDGGADSSVFKRTGLNFGLVIMSERHPLGGGYIFGFDDVRLEHEGDSARLWGSMIDRKTGDDGWSVSYAWDGCLEPFGAGFIDRTGCGSGRVSYDGPGAFAFSLGREAMGGVYAAFGDSRHGFGLHAWTGGTPGPNDFIATATPVPLPAGWALLLAALGWLGLARRAS